MRLRNLVSRFSTRIALNVFFVFVVLITLIAGYSLSQTWAHSTSQASAVSANQAFNQASSTYGVPVELLKAICYMEGRLSNNGGEATQDNGFGCMHLVRNAHFDTLDKAANALGVSMNQLRADMPTNIRGGAYILREDALQLSSRQRLPSSLGYRYHASTLYSDDPNHSHARMNAYPLSKI